MRKLKLLSRRSSAAVIALAGVGVAPAARSQQIDRYFPANVPGYDVEPGVTVLSRQRPEYDPLGVRLGAVTVRPSLDEGVSFDDNVFGTPHKKGSAIISTAPTVDVRTDTSRYSLGLVAGLTDLEYLNQPTQSRTNYSVTGGGSYNLGRDVATLALGYQVLNEDQTALNTAGLNRPVRYEAGDVRAGYQATLGRWGLAPVLEFQTYRFDNQSSGGQFADQTFRDRNVILGELTTRYELAPQRNLLAVVRVANTSYVSSTLALKPDSNAYEVLVGADYVLTGGKLRVRALVGYELRQFTNAAYSNRSAPVAEASLIWTPTGLTSVTGRLSRSIEDAVGETTTGVTYTSAGLTVDHEYLRNVLLQGTVRLDSAEYLQNHTSETIYSVGAGVTYLLNRNVRLGASYLFSARQGSSSVTNTAQPVLNGNPFTTTFTGGDYTRDVFLLRVQFAL